MEHEFINIGLAFLEGLALVASPCILPLLPIILAGSLEGGKQRPAGIIIGFILVFSLFTLFARKLVLITGIDLGLVRNISYGFLIALGFIMISSVLTEKFSQWTMRLSNFATNVTSTNTSTHDLIAGLIFGALLALVWTPCAGPILAAVIVQTIIQKTTAISFLILLAFGFGVAIPMILIAWLGRNIITRVPFLRTRAETIRKILGGIIIVSVILMIFADRLALFSTETYAIQSQEDTEKTHLINGLKKPYAAPAIQDIAAWINANPLTIENLKGKVVLLDFWAYSCINCIRTFPDLKRWYEKYHSLGLEIIGIHSPEFDFERNYNNVKQAVEQFGLHYPIALDNNFTTWLNYKNHYWPASYLIDKNGNVVYEHFGEGDAAVTENNIRYLLGINSEKMVEEKAHFGFQTPETYLGYERAETFNNPDIFTQHDQPKSYRYPVSLPLNRWGLQGQWIISREKIISNEKNAAIKIHFQAGKVFAVMGSNTGKPIRVQILLNGKPVSGSKEGKGEDVDNESTVEVNQFRLYRLINMPSAQQGELQLIALNPGLELYTFTFGN